jgi:antitoxin component of RelBE/YafQ-DinJ toxin-antitoxin module
MSKRIDDMLAAEAKAVEEAEAAMSDPNATLAPNVKVTRGHPRARNLQVRFRDDEFDELAAYAEQRGLPVSTLVRTLVLQAIAPPDDLRSALDKLETDLAAVRRKALRA